MARGRPKKPRKIAKEPYIRQFSPRGRHGRPGYVTLGLDEFEAIRLTDFLGYSQNETAESMKISQQTLSRVLKRARKSIAEGIALGLIINIKPSKKGKIKPKNKPLKKHIKPA